MKTVAILKVMDRYYKTEKDDVSSNIAKEICEENGFSVIEKVVVPLDKEQIEDELRRLSDKKINIILTIGGTGFSKDDCTPEATMEVADRMCLGIAQAMMYNNLDITERAMLSRAVSVIRKESIIINLSGDSKIIDEGLTFIIGTLKYGSDVLLGKI